MIDADLKLYVGVTEYGTLVSPVSFPAVKAGAITPHTLNPFYLWNDKGGLLGSVPANNVTIQVLDMWIENENKGASDGSMNQTITCSVIPVVDNADPDEIIVKVGTDIWTRIANFSGMAADAEVYTFDSTTGIATFGDGVNGKIPPLGQVRYITYMPDLLLYGKEVFENTWLEVKSLGATSNPVSVVDEQQTSTDTTHVTVANGAITVVAGVWLLTDPGHAGTNYYTGGSFDSVNKVLTLGSALPAATTAVLVSYSYQMIDDLESVYTAIGENVTHTFTNPIPQNNAKLLYFQLNVPAAATPSGGSQVNFRLEVTYSQ